MPDTLLRTKLFVPSLRPNLVPRPHLIERLNQGLRFGQKLFLISAPAGFGKTTLVADWFSQLAAKSALLLIQDSTWLTLDQNDNDPVRFLAYFVAALKKIEAGMGETTLALLQSPQRPPADAILTSLINELAAASSQFVFVLDDYHAIQSPYIHELLTFVLDSQLTQMRLAVLTREDPPLPVARMRARGELTELRQEELRFTAGETAYFLQDIMKLDLTEGDVAALEQRTEGWIAGLQLAALSMQGQADLKQFIRAFTGSNRFVLDYLMEEVFERQSPEVQDFLLKTAVLDRLSGPLSDAVADCAGSQRILQSLEQANLFIAPLDQSRHWYRYHRLFAELLRHRLRTTAGYSESALHRKAAGWHEAYGDITDAVQHALAAQAWSEAERMITLASAEAIRSGQFVAMHGWLELLPEDIVERSGSLSTFKAWALFFAGDFEGAVACAAAAARLLSPEASPFHRGTLTALNASLSIYQFDIPKAIELSQKTLEILGDDDPHFLRGMALHNLGIAHMQLGNVAAAARAYRQLIRLGRQAGHHLSTFGSTGILAGLLNLQGKRREAMALCRQGLDECVDSRGRPLPLAGSIHIYLGINHLEANELDQAQEHIQLGIKLSKSLGPAGGIMNGLAALAGLQQAMGQPETALATVQEIRQATAQLNLPYAAGQVAGLEADIQMKQANVIAVQQWAETAGLSPDDTPNAFREQEYFTFARLLLAQDRLEEAQTLLASFEAFAQEGGRYRSLISIHLLRALVAQALGRKDEAIAKLGLALRMAAPENYQRAFIEDGRLLAPLLPGLRSLAPVFVAQLSSAFQAEPSFQVSTPLAQPLAEPLSQRELEILRLAADGLTNREIAESVFISVGTVKSHIHHILEKLGVGNRTQAVACARELKLL